MRPPLIYPQLPHFYNHGLAIPFHFIWKETFEECFSPRLSSKFPSPQRDGALKREREREKKNIEKREEEKRKAPRVSANKMGKSIFWGEKHLNFKIFLRESIFSLSIIPFSKPFPKSFEKVS
jgi:hypothetical protein